MSGGYFDYNQFRIQDIATMVAELESRAVGYSPEVLAKFNEAHKCLRRAFVYAHRIDWFVSGDDGEEQFLKRLAEELEGI